MVLWVYIYKHGGCMGHCKRDAVARIVSPASSRVSIYAGTKPVAETQHGTRYVYYLWLYEVRLAYTLFAR